MPDRDQKKSIFNKRKKPAGTREEDTEGSPGGGQKKAKVGKDGLAYCASHRQGGRPTQLAKLWRKGFAEKVRKSAKKTETAIRVSHGKTD